MYIAFERVRRKISPTVVRRQQIGSVQWVGKSDVDRKTPKIRVIRAIPVIPDSNALQHKDANVLSTCLKPNISLHFFQKKLFDKKKNI